MDKRDNEDGGNGLVFEAQGKPQIRNDATRIVCSSAGQGFKWGPWQHARRRGYFICLVLFFLSCRPAILICPRSHLFTFLHAVEIPILLH